jgi:nuclear pore complex protein Nup155
MIYEAADHRNEADINATWQQLLEATHTKVVEEGSTQLPYEAVVTMMKDMAHRLNLSETTFSPSLLIPLIEKYALEFQQGLGPRTWVPDLFVDVGFPYETIISILQGMWYNNIAPFTGRRKGILAEHIIYICQLWYEDCVRTNTRLFGGDDNAQEIADLLALLSERDLSPESQERGQELRRKIVRAFR